MYLHNSESAQVISDTFLKNLLRCQLDKDVGARRDQSQPNGNCNADSNRTLSDCDTTPSWVGHNRYLPVTTWLVAGAIVSAATTKTKPLTCVQGGLQSSYAEAIASKLNER